MPKLFDSDRALLLTEPVVLVKLVMFAAGYPFVLAGRSIRARLRRPRPAPRSWLLTRRRKVVAGWQFLISLSQIPCPCQSPADQMVNVSVLQ